MSNNQLAYAPAEMRISYSGECYRSRIFLQNKLYQQIVLLCYKEPKTVSQLSDCLETRSEYIKDAVNDMESIGMLKKSDLSYSTAFPMIHEYTEYKAGEVVNKALLKNNIPQRINDLLISKKDQIAAIDFYGNDFDIKYLNWFLYQIVNEVLLTYLRAYYLDKTDEIAIDKHSWKTQNYEFSNKIMYRFPDEKPAEITVTNTVDKVSTDTRFIGDVRVQNTFAEEPFSVRNDYINAKNILIYLKLSDKVDLELTEYDPKHLNSLIETGAVVKTTVGDRISYKPMIPVFTEEALNQLEKLLEKDLKPFAKEIAESVGSQVEQLLLPEMQNVKSRLDQFYIFWLCYILSPIQELNWFGLNQGGFEIPEDYNKSVAGMFIVK